ncbi:hypothetical protein BH683_017650 [Williamsia sp. 1138]|uniref:AAA family ATPase n=1 Tax=Williamsia sp. 1138 TaxID=1903117 RepID=UPI000B9B601F|nr:AAA family ATPase [Williamsia sp. 1138]OZG27696.1 hypothetical protein BH683_017650 [Williamsia sp. 1138]
MKGPSAVVDSPGASDRGEFERLTPEEFFKHGKRLLDLGWHPIPLGNGRADVKGKTPLVIGVTGHEGKDIETTEELRKWADRLATRAGGMNLGTRMPMGVIGIDIDCYDGKPGAETIRRHEAKWGSLPATWSLTARTDGSRKLFFRVPVGWAGPGVLAEGGVEILQRHHRYAVAPPSVHHSGTRVRAFDPAGEECVQLPRPSELPELPVSWLQGLDHHVEALTKATVAEGREVWSSFKSGPMTPEVAEQVNGVLDAIHNGASRFDACRNAIFALVGFGLERHSGVAPALRTIEDQYLGAIGPIRGQDAARGEIERMIQGALRKMAANHPAAQMTEDDWVMGREAFAPGGAWHPDNPRGNAYRHPGTIDGQPVRSPEGRQFTQSLAGVEPTKVQWLWWPWIPLGKLTMFEGEPDVGKSTMTLAWAATVSNGGSWPRSVVGETMSSNEKGLHEPADVVLVGMEDDLADTVVPRLNAAGADLSRISTMARPRDRDGRPIPFLIPEDVDKLKRAIEEVEAKLVVIDPISAFMSDTVKAGSDSSNRKALMELVDVAEQTGAAVVLVRHLNKATGMNAKHRGGGSIAFTALARSALIAAKLPRTDDRENTQATHGLASIKGNLSREPKALGYRLISSLTDADSPVVRWEGVLDENADQLVGADGIAGDARKSAPARDEAERMIGELLSAGPMDAQEVRRAVMREVGCSAKTVANAANKMRVIKKAVRDSSGRVTHWMWTLSGRLERSGGDAGGG